MKVQILSGISSFHPAKSKKYKNLMNTKCVLSLKKKYKYPLSRSYHSTMTNWYNLERNIRYCCPESVSKKERVSSDIFVTNIEPVGDSEENGVE